YGQGVNSRTKTAAHGIRGGEHKGFARQFEGHVHHKRRRREFAKTLEKPMKCGIYRPLNNMQPDLVSRQQESAEKIASRRFRPAQGRHKASGRRLLEIFPGLLRRNGHGKGTKIFTML